MAWSECGSRIHRMRGTGGRGPARLIVTTALAVLCAAAAAAAEGRSGEAPRVVAEAEAKTFDIPAQPLSGALTAFGRQSGFQVSVDTALLEGLRSPGVTGALAPEEALRRLLAGTGLAYRFTNPTTVTMERPVDGSGAVTLAPLTVEGSIPYESAYTRSDSYRASNATVGSKTDATIREVPASIQVVTQQVLEDQRRLSVTDALVDNVSGVTRDTLPRIYGDNLRIRGFVANGNYLRDGVPDNQIGRKTGGTLADVERIEVLKGPASVLYGVGAPGGTVNILTKQPLYEPLYDVGGTVGSYGFSRFDADVSQPFVDDGSIAGRLNVAFEDTDAFVDFEQQRLYSITPVMRFDIRDATRLTLEASYTHQNTRATRSGLPYIGTVTAGPDGMFIPDSRNLNQPNNSDQHFNTVRAGYRFETELSDLFTFRSQGDYARYRQTGRSYGMLAGGEAFGFGLQADGRTYGTALYEPRGGDNAAVDSTDIYYTDNNLLARFKTGPVSHKALLGASFSYEDALNNNYQISGPFFIDVYDPVYTDPSAAPIVELTNKTITRQYGFYAQEQIGLFDDRLKLIGTGRYDIVRITGTDELLIFGGGAPTNLSVRDSNFTARGGVVFDATKQVSVYASYAQSYVPQTAVDASGQVIEPETGEQYEVGVKADWFDGKLSTTMALFDLTRDNVARNVNLSVSASGKQRSRGLEIDVTGEILPGWKAIGSLTYMDTKVLADSNPAEEGLSIANTPDLKFTLASTYTLQSGWLKDFTLGGGLLYLDERRVQNTNTPALYMPSFWRFDLMAGYRYGPMDLQLNVQNVLDRRYFVAGVDTNEIYDGDPMTVLFTARLRF